jgi:hypothetical protein
LNGCLAVSNGLARMNRILFLTMIVNHKSNKSKYFKLAQCSLWRTWEHFHLTYHHQEMAEK